MLPYSSFILDGTAQITLYNQNWNADIPEHIRDKQYTSTFDARNKHVGAINNGSIERREFLTNTTAHISHSILSTLATLLPLVGHQQQACKKSHFRNIRSFPWRHGLTWEDIHCVQKKKPTGIFFYISLEKAKICTKFSENVLMILVFHQRKS